MHITTISNQEQGQAVTQVTSMKKVFTLTFIY